jgi:hypothetical protein
MSASPTRFGTDAVNSCCGRSGATGNPRGLSIVVGGRRWRPEPECYAGADPVAICAQGWVHTRVAISALAPNMDPPNIL